MTRSATAQIGSCALPLAVLLRSAVGGEAGLRVAPVLRQPNPPRWPPSVQVFGPDDDPDLIEAAVGRAFEENGGQRPINHGEFSSARFAFLFKPGKYHVEVPVGYYTQVLGLGRDPDEVIFDSRRGIYCEEGNAADIFGSLSTFWRGAENFRTRGNMLWATSQATPVRRAIIDGDLVLAQYRQDIGMGYASGGFVGNVRIDGVMQLASQQQYCTRNAALANSSAGGVWNMVFVGTAGAPKSRCGRGSKGQSATVTVDATPVIAEKPFISIDAVGKYYLHVPRVQHTRIGTDFSWGRVIEFSEVYVATSTDTAAVINRHLQAGLHVVLSPGIYFLEAALQLNIANQVLLGLGLATLAPVNGNAVVQVGNVDGVRVAGVLLQAGPGDTDALLEWGDGAYRGNAQNPGFLHDVFARVGGTNDPAQMEVRAKVMVRIASGHVVGDNLWLWRADHDIAGVIKGGVNPCNTGLVVTGNNVTMYGLAVEHTLHDLLQWSGEGGETYFYQSELPYDVTQAFGYAGYAGYRVNQSVESHHAYGVGVYHYFRDHEVMVQRGISAPPWLANSFTSPLAVFLSGHGSMSHIINSRGGRTAPASKGSAQAQWSCKKGPDVPYMPPPPTTTATTSATMTSTSTATTTTSTTTTATATGTATTTTSTLTGTTTTFTTTSTTTTSTTTTTPAVWWQILSTQPYRQTGGFFPWLVLGFSLQTAVVCVLVVCACCRRSYRTDTSDAPRQEPQVPVSHLLRLLTRRSRHPATKGKGHCALSPGPSRSRLSAMSPAATSSARDLSMSMVGQSLLEGLSPSPAGSPVRTLALTPQRTARTLSMSGLDASGFSETPGGPALLSPWLRNSPLWRAHGPDGAA